jgi:hypothetical protein
MDYKPQKRRPAIPVATSRAVLEAFERAGRHCVLCGWTVPPGEKPHVDHILPVSRGGSDDITNLRGVHARCNGLKSDRTDEEYKEYIEQISRPTTCRFCGLVRRSPLDFTVCQRCSCSVCLYCAIVSSDYVGVICPRCDVIIAYDAAHAKQDADGRPIVFARVLKDSTWRHGSLSWSACSRYLLEISCPYCRKAHRYDGGEYFRELSARAGYRETTCGADNGKGYVLDVPKPVTVHLTVDWCLWPERIRLADRRWALPEEIKPTDRRWVPSDGNGWEDEDEEDE